MFSYPHNLNINLCKVIINWFNKNKVSTKLYIQQCIFWRFDKIIMFISFKDVTEKLKLASIIWFGNEGWKGSTTGELYILSWLSALPVEDAVNRFNRINVNCHTNIELYYYLCEIWVSCYSKIFCFKLSLNKLPL